MKKIFILFCASLFSLSSQAQYCVPDPGMAGCSDGDMVDDFVLFGEAGTSIVNLATGCSLNAYEDHTTDSVSLGQNTIYMATVSTQYSDPDENVAIWIDLNDDLIFSGSELLGSATGILTSGSGVSISIPATAPLGAHRMRVYVQYGILPVAMDPCNTGGASDYGEAHDYTVNVVTPPTCLPPSSAGSSTVLPNSVSLTISGGTAPFSIEYGPAGFIPGSGTFISSLSDTVTINGLTPGSSYTVYVRSICNIADSSTAVAYTFNTLCTTSAVPYTEDFDGVSEPDVPACITLEDVNGDNELWFTADFGGGAPSNPNALVFSSMSGAAPDDWFFTPGINMTTGTIYEISFKYITSGFGPENLDVFAASAPSSSSATGTPLFANANLLDTAFTTATVFYTPATTSPVYFGWHLHSQAMSFGIAIDDISITEATTTPACDTAQNLTTMVTGNSSAITSWDAVPGAASYEYVINQSPATPSGAGIAITNISYSAAGLLPGTVYYFHLRTNCGSNFSAWTVDSFTTDPLDIHQVDINEDGILIYPNPATDHVMISGKGISRSAEIILTDLPGKKLKTAQVDGNTARIDMTGLNAGVYLIQYISNGQTHVMKIMKQ